MTTRTAFLPLSLSGAVVLTSALMLPVPAIANQWAAEGNIALRGTNLTYYPQPNQAVCLATCVNNGSCRGATWIQAGTYNARDPAMCYLLSAVTERVAVRGHVSMVKTVATPPPQPQPPQPPQPPANATRATWYTAGKLNTPDGQRVSFFCPPLGSDGFLSIWGTDIYTYDSGICMAGAHTGVITRERGGVVTIEMRPGQSAYPATSRYGIASQGYAGYPKSFAVVR